jgi:hypothetical protein
MAKKKNAANGGKPTTAKSSGAPGASKAKAATKPNRLPWIVAGVLVVGVVAALIFTGGSGGSKSAFGVPADEAKYMGRLLPASYQEPSVAGAQTYTSTVKMTDVKPDITGTQIAVPTDAVVSNKLVYFEYPKTGGDAIPLIAYVKPSGKLFVGVSFCPPCKGKGQTIEADFTLTCATCGTKRTLETGVGVSGACKRYPLDEVAATIVGGKIVVDKAALDKWTPQPLDRPVGA